MSKKIILIVLIMASFKAQASEIEILNPWIRATVGNQKISGGFLNIKTNEDVILYKIHTNIANKVEMHTMKMQNNAMYMYEVPSIALSKNTLNKLDGEYHLMFVGLHKKLNINDKVKVNLFFKDKNNKSTQTSQEFIVKPISYTP